MPGGSQALVRQEEVTVRLSGNSFTLRRPTLLGAILIKARSLIVHRDLESQREDLLMLLSLDEGAAAPIVAELEGGELKKLREVAAMMRAVPASALAEVYGEFVDRSHEAIAVPRGSSSVPRASATPHTTRKMPAPHSRRIAVMRVKSMAGVSPGDDAAFTLETPQASYPSQTEMAARFVATAS